MLRRCHFAGMVRVFLHWYCWWTFHPPNQLRCQVSRYLHCFCPSRRTPDFVHQLVLSIWLVSRIAQIRKLSSFLSKKSGRLSFAVNSDAAPKQKNSWSTQIPAVDDMCIKNSGAGIPHKHICFETLLTRATKMSWEFCPSRQLETWGFFASCRNCDKSGW